MLEIITGGSGSGKSELAEKLAVARAKTGNGEGSSHSHYHDYHHKKLYYIAAMIPQDAECQERIARHRFMRRDKGFQTVECYHHLQQLELEPGSVALMECLSNLLANEMYQEQGQLRGYYGDSCHGESYYGESQYGELYQQAAAAILEPILEMEKRGIHVIVVTNEIFSDGERYAEETERYVGCLGWLNRELAKRADLVVEVICGIPLVQKGELPCCDQ